MDLCVIRFVLLNDIAGDKAVMPDKQSNKMR